MEKNIKNSLFTNFRNKSRKEISNDSNKKFVDLGNNNVQKKKHSTDKIIQSKHISASCSRVRSLSLHTQNEK